MPSSLGFDFGTTNSVVVLPGADGQSLPIIFRDVAAEFSAFRSVLCFWEEQTGGRPEVQAAAGPRAIAHFIENVSDCRFLQSLKSFAASHLFQNTRIYGRAYAFEQLLEAFFALLRAEAGASLAELPERFVLGRPVHFAGSNPDAALALSRYRAAMGPFGVRDIRFVYEPVGAAFYFARRLSQDATVLVADFGGGTSDFSIMRFEMRDGAVHPRALAWSGVDVAGDTFDFRIIDRVVAPQLGKDSQYRDWGKALPMPRRFYTSLARWNELSIMKSSRALRELQELRDLSEEPEKITAFIDLIEGDLGYRLYRAVSQAKEQLSRQDSTEFHFDPGALDIHATITRAAFNGWIADDLAKMAGAVDTALDRAGLETRDIDRVFLTGGTSFVPAVRALFETRFGADRIETGDELVSIAHGLAMIGGREDIDLWCVDENGEKAAG